MHENKLFLKFKKEIMEIRYNQNKWQLICLRPGNLWTMGRSFTTDSSLNYGYVHSIATGEKYTLLLHSLFFYNVLLQEGESTATSASTWVYLGLSLDFSL